MNRRKFLKAIAATWTAAAIPPIVRTEPERYTGWIDLGGGAGGPVDIDFYQEGSAAYGVIVDAKGLSISEVYEQVKFYVRRFDQAYEGLKIET